MPPRGRGHGRSGGRVGSGVSKLANIKSSKKSSVRGGLKRGRAKIVPDPPRILELKARKAELGISFRVIGSHQRAALYDLAQKSLDALKIDTKYHESLPEFERLTNDLNVRHNDLLATLEARRRYDEELVQRDLKHMTRLIEKKFENKLNDLKEEGIAKIQESILYVERMSWVGGRIEEIPFNRGEDGRKVTKLAAPPKIVHPVALPFSKGQLADTKSSIKIGDNHLEQHPTNFWMSRTDSQRKAITAQQNSIIEANLKVAEDEKRGIYKKRTVTANSLFNPSAVSGMAMDVDEDDLQAEDQLGLPDISTPDDQDQMNGILDDAAEMSLDEYGVRIPNKKIRATSKARPNNYMVVPRAFDFEDAEGQILEDGSVGIQEIGFRTWTTKNVKNRDYYIGSDNSPNPQFFFIPQRVGDINSGNNTIEDMRSVEHIIRTHKLHPILGIILSQSVNPDYHDLKDPYFPPPTDKKCPLGSYKPHMIIQDNSDGTKSVFRIQRSWLKQTNESYIKIVPQNKMKALLRATGDYKEPKKYSSDFYHESGRIHQDLVDAVMAALDNKRDNMTPKESAPPSKVSTPHLFKMSVLSNKPGKNIQRTFRPHYDPVRDSFPTLLSNEFVASSSDSTSRKQYKQNSPRVIRSTPKQMIQVPLNKSTLDELAEHASGASRASVYPPTAQKISIYSSSTSTAIPSTTSPPKTHHLETLQPKPAIQTRIPPMNLQFQYHGTQNPVPYPTQLNSSHVQQNLTNPYPLNQPMMLASGYPMLYVPNTSSQSAYKSQGPIHNSLSLQSLPPSAKSCATYFPPPVSYIPRPSSQITHVNQSSPPQASPAHGALSSNTLRELRPAATQIRAQFQSTMPPPAPSPQIYTWNKNGNFHPQSHP